MGRSFFWIALVAILLLVLLFFPIVFHSSAHFDVNRKKFAFSVRLYGNIKLIGGYITTYKGGVALHISPKKAILIPYKEMENERKKFSFFKTLRLIAFTLTTETGAEYLFPVALAHIILRVYFFSVGGNKEKIENNLWLTDGDVLRVSSHGVFFFNLFILTVHFFKFLKEKIIILCRKKSKKSTT